MGVTVESLFTHNMKAGDLEQIPRLLNAPLLTEAELIKDEWFACTEPGLGTYETFLRNHVVGLEGPDRFIGEVYENTIAISHASYWHTFIREPESLELRREFRRCAARFHAPVIIYFPSNDPGDPVHGQAESGKSLSEIEAWLTSEHGAPAKNLKELRDLSSVWFRQRLDQPDHENAVFD